MQPTRASETSCRPRRTPSRQRSVFCGSDCSRPWTAQPWGRSCSRRPRHALIHTRMQTLLLALFVGLSMGTGLALLAERFDDRLHGRQDLAARAAAPVLATIPRLRSWGEDGEPVLATVSAPRSDTSEAYRTLRTGVLRGLARPHQDDPRDELGRGRGKNDDRGESRRRPREGGEAGHRDRRRSTEASPREFLRDG